MGQRRVQPCVVGIGRRIGQYLGGVVHRRRAHTGSSLPGCGCKLDGCQVRSLCDAGHAKGRPGFDLLPLGSDFVLPASVRRRGRCVLALCWRVAGGRVRPRRRRAARGPVRAAPVGSGGGADRRGPGARRRRARSPAVRRNPLCRTACRAAALAAARACTGLARGARRHPPGPAMHPGPGVDLDLGRQTDEDCLTLNVWTPPTTTDAAAGDGVDPRRRVHQRQRRRSTTRDGWPVGATSSSSPSTTGSARWASWPIPRWARQATSATTGWPTSRRRCAGCATTSPTSAAIPARSRWPANRRAACRCATTSSRRARRACSGRRSSRALRARRRPRCRAAEKTQPRLRGRSRLRRSGDPQRSACAHLPADKLREAGLRTTVSARDQLTGPVTGTTVLPVDPITGFADGRAARVPVLIGSNRDEFTLFVALQYLRLGRDFTTEQYPRAAYGNLRRQRRRGRRALPAGALTTAVCRLPIRRRSPTGYSPA